MPAGTPLVMPSLADVATEHRWESSFKRSARLAQQFVRLGLVGPDDWKSERTPRNLVHTGLQRWVEQQGASTVRKQFSLNLSLVSALDPYGEPETASDDAAELYLCLEADAAAYLVAGPALESMASVHPRLPATFYGRFCSAVNQWARIYDHLDALERVDMLREWLAQEPEPGYELPDIEGTIPKYLLRARALSGNGLKRVARSIRNPQLRTVFALLDRLESAAKKATRPVLSEAVCAHFMDCNPPLPALLAVMSPHDAIEACWDEASQTMLEVTPEPSLIVPLCVSDLDSVRRALKTIGAACETLAVASELITALNRLAGRDEGIES